MSMTAESQDDWCTMVCNYDASSCDPKACRCGTKNDLVKWRKEKQHTDDNLTKEPWDVENACDFDAVGCNQKLTKNCAAAANLTCSAHITNCMSTPHLDKNNRAIRVSMAECVDAIADGVDECSDCKTPESKEAYALRLGPNAADPSAKNEAEAERVKETSEANAKAFEGAKTATNNAKAAAIARQEAAVAEALAASISPPPTPPQEPPSPPAGPEPPAAPKMEAKDLLKANRKQAEIVYKENNAKEFWDKAAEAEDRYLSEPSTRTPSGSMKTSGSKDIAKEEQRKASEADKMAEDRQKEIDVEEKRKAKEATRRATETAKEAKGEAGRKDKATKEQSDKQQEIQEEEKRKTAEHDKMESERIKTAEAEEERKAAEASVLEEERLRELEEANKKKEAEDKRLEEEKEEEKARLNEHLEEEKRKAQDADDLAAARIDGAEAEQKRKIAENEKMAG